MILCGIPISGKNEAMYVKLKTQFQYGRRTIKLIAVHKWLNANVLAASALMKVTSSTFDALGIVIVLVQIYIGDMWRAAVVYVRGTIVCVTCSEQRFFLAA